MADDDNTELIVAVVALVISVLAFVIAILQALQQYFASATGFSSCSDVVIGKWSKFARRQMRWSEFRFEVQFEVPVIFVARPTNTRGPLGDDKDVADEGRKIVHLDGSENNFQYTSTIQEFDEQSRKSKQQLVHTADNEKATWYELLMAIVRMEKESRTWQEKKASEWQSSNGPPKDLLKDSPNGSPAQSEAASTANHSLLVCMQRKKLTWDSMPEGLGKPYATTTISHLVEIAAMLGIHWKKFDLDNDQYRAQGNGFVLYGSYVGNLGITFTFRKQGPTWFEKNRVVPNYNVKKLCFGLAPTIFDPNKLVFADEPKDLGSLQLGSLSEISQTLSSFGCDLKTVNLFRKNVETARHSHIFPFPFELLGMVGEILHVKDTVFRMLPNPTVFYWEPSNFSLSTLILEFSAFLRGLVKDGDMKDNEQLSRIIDWVDDNRPSLVRACTSSLEDVSVDANGAKLIHELNHMREGVELCDAYFQKTGFVVWKVVRVHTQEVLGALNRQAENNDGSKTEDAKKAKLEGQISIQDIDSAFTGDKESLLVEMYTKTIRQNVIRIVCEQDAISKQRRAMRDSDNNGRTTDAKANLAEDVTPRLVNETWCTLMFRMLCWLQLHDFHKMDIQVSKSEAYASRIPVHIT